MREDFEVKIVRVLVFLVMCIVLTMPAQAVVKPDALFSDGAVLQQGISVPVWGTAANGEKVTVKFLNQTVSTKAEDSRWMVHLKPLKAGGPYTMTISGENTVEVKNILIGEVWICSGQSNMEFQLRYAANAEPAIASSKDSQIRLFKVPKRATADPKYDVDAAWNECGSGTVNEFSAVGYFFGRGLRRQLNVPIGLIETSWGGTPAQAWTSMACLQANPVTKPMIDEHAPKDEDPKSCTALYNGMVVALQPYAIKGVIWYQGETNAADAFRYKTLFPVMIDCWRKAWSQGNFPFLFVQLAPFGKLNTEPVDSHWAELREAQRLTAESVPNTAMAVITDYGNPDNIHPKWKEPVGDRLAAAALAKVYGRDVPYQGPSFKSMEVFGNRVVLSFDNVTGGLEARGGELTGWTIAGDDHKFVNAHASIVGDMVVVSSPDVAHPSVVRYGWSDAPVVNLFNKVGFPASPFSTTDLPWTTKK
ncbi:sialate O-acetylesterase [bacterium]|nr:sialate O-acetylesterase [bacterium]